MFGVLVTGTFSAVVCGSPASSSLDWGYAVGSTSKNFNPMKVISQAPRELRQLVRCLDLYYRQGRHQKDIARSLGVSAATVSRLLKRAFDEGFVRVELDLPPRGEPQAGRVR